MLGSGIGRASYVVTAAELQTVNPGNLMVEYFVISACSVQSRAAELDNVEAWAEKNNLRLNRRKSVEIIFADGRCRRQCRVNPQPHLPEVTRVTTLKILGVTISSSLSVVQHVNLYDGQRAADCDAQYLQCRDCQ